MRAVIINIFTFIIILKFIILQKTLVSGQLSDLRPSISIESCAEMKGFNDLNIKGAKGEKGFDGIQGSRGPGGFPGTCKCACPPRILFNTDESEDTFISCKYPEDEEPEINVRQESPFVVACQYSGTNIHTCLKRTNQLILNEQNREEISFALGDKPFWLSERLKDKDEQTIMSSELNLTNFYFGYDKSKLEFLQKHSAYVFQKLRFHCKNTVPKEILQVLTWKERLAGPEATDLNPFHYDIQYDGCQDSFQWMTNRWSYTDIELLSDLGRLPVLDFYIKNGNRDQKFYIELLELCFG